MRVVLQRAKTASVDVNGKEIASIKKGLLLLVGIGKNDTDGSIEHAARKICRLRVFGDAEGKMNLDIKQVEGEILSVSQFTLLGDISKGNRPGFENAGAPEVAEGRWKYFNEILRKEGIVVQEGIFGAHMNVNMVNEGPVTFVVDSWED